MFPEIKPGTTNNTAGWNCAACGLWVNSGGKPHYCSLMRQPATFDFTSGTPLVDVELHNKLDKIAELLGRIVRKLGA